jgi:hypothetical protein
MAAILAYGGRVLVDHVTYVSPDAAAMAADLRERHGLGTERNGYLPHVGARSWSVPLAPPSYLEILEVETPDVAAGSPLGRSLLDVRDAGGALVAWCVVADDLAAVAARTGIAPYDGMTEGVYGTLGWHTVSGPAHLPFFIVYDDDGARAGRLAARYERVAHDSAPTRFSRIDVAGDPAELDAWLGPHDLPVRHVDGPPGLVSVTIATARGDVEVR